MRRIKSIVEPGHSDYEGLRSIASVVVEKMGGHEQLQSIFPEMIRDVIDRIIDPVTTGRTRFEHLDNVEKTFIGLKVEHVLRDLMDVPKGLRDLIINGMDVDVKNTVRDTWTIPPETYRDEEPCLLIASDEATNECWFGVIFARDQYLTQGKNRDGKRSVSAEGFRHIWWMLEAHSYPKSRWLNIDMERFRYLRGVKFGSKRLAMFLRENTNMPIHRTVIQALLFDQKDYMKRVRGNGGVRDVLRREKIAVLSGAYDSGLIRELDLPATGSEEIIAVWPISALQERLMRAKGVID